MWTPLITSRGNCYECGRSISRLHGYCKECDDAIRAENAYQDALAEAAYERGLDADAVVCEDF